MKTLIFDLLLLLVVLQPVFSQMQSDTSDNYWEVVMPLSASHDIDMKQVLLGNSKDSVITDFIQNNGSWKFSVDSIYFRGADASAFSQVSGFPKYDLGAGLSNAAEFHFVPNRVGLHQAEIVVITQADTLIQTIRGEGVQLALSIVSDIIDFGVVIVGSNIDTLQAATIVNVSSSPLTITRTEHSWPNDKDFSTLAGGGNFTLQPGDTCKMDLRFTPSDAGRTSGTLLFYYNGVGSPAMVQLFGVGVKDIPVIQGNMNGFPDLICGYKNSQNAVITNTGEIDLEIKDLNLKGANPNEFSLAEQTPIIIEPDSAKNIVVSFIPNSVGVKSAELEIVSNAIPDSFYIISLSAKKDSVSIIPETNTIDLGFLCPGESIDSSFSIRKTGTIPSGAFSRFSNNLTSQVSEIYFQVDESQNLQFSFNGAYTEGFFEEIITITDSICGYSKEIKITGEVAVPVIDADDISISSAIGQQKDAFITVSNNSKRAYTITGISGIANPFEIIGNSFPLEVPVSESRQIPVRYLPDDDTDDNITIEITAEPCDISKLINILGMPINSFAVIKAISAEGKPGDIVEIDLVLNDMMNIDVSGTNTFNTELSFNSSLLYPLDIPMSENTNSIGKITLNDLPVNFAKGDVLESIRFTVGLGNFDGCDLILSNAEAVDGNAEITTINGRFTLLGICDEGGKRLINPFNEAGIISIKPNPVENEIEVEFSTSEKGFTEIALYNILGEKVRPIFSDHINKTGKKTISQSTDDMSPGYYLLVFRSKTKTETYTIMIVR
jgi:hypothetical protein